MSTPLSKWDLRFLELATLLGSWSKDPSTKLGCVIVGPNKEIRSTGFNGFARGVGDHPERYGNRETKLAFIVHAEENAIIQAARVGISLEGCTAYVGWPPCVKCARALIQVGVKEVVVPNNTQVPLRWAESFEQSVTMFKEAGITLRPQPFGVIEKSC